MGWFAGFSDEFLDSVGGGTVGAVSVIGGACTALALPRAHGQVFGEFF